MEEKQIFEIRNRVTTLLDERRLKEAIDILGTDIDSLQDWDLRTRFAEMQTAYGYLLEYLRNGTPDTSRKRMHTELLGECYQLNDLIAISRLTEFSTSVYCQHRRKYRSTESIGSLHKKLQANCEYVADAQMLPSEERKKATASIMQEHETIVSKLFGTLWSGTSWSKGELSEIENLLNDATIPVNDRAMFISAITFGLIKCFEETRSLLLLRTTFIQETTLSARAIVGAIIVFSLYDKRIALFPSLTQALSSISEDSTLVKRAETIQIQLLRCRETQKIDRKMREEIIPAMLKNPHLNGGKVDIDILKEIEQDEEKNPEWKKWVDKDKIKDKLEEMTQWQMEGADVYMSTFSQLKNYPFFNEIHNWLRPFDNKIPVIAEIMPEETSSKSIFGAICASNVFCNSDKFSFCLTFKQIMKEQREMLMQQLDGGNDEDIDNNLSKIQDKEEVARIASNQYIQDLYRFFKLSHFRKEFDDPFTLSLNMLDTESLASLVKNPQGVFNIFTHLFNKEYYDEAFSVGKIYESMHDASPDECFYQEMGFCLQNNHDYTAAIDYYTRADIIKPDTLWTLRHIARCYRLQGEPDKALSYYLLAEEIAPDDLSLLRQTGECFATLKRYDEAFARFFKIEYMNPSAINALRAIAWCSFVTGKEEQARNYYNKIMQHPKAKFEDYMNAAHVEWIARCNSTAVDLYRKAKSLCNNDTIFDNCMKQDYNTLLELGADKDELWLLHDLLC